MFKCKFALVFLVVLAVYLKQSQGHPIVDKKVAKVPIVAAATASAAASAAKVKVGIAKTTAAKIKLAAFKKWAATKAIVKAPFVLGKKVALLKIGAVKALAALKVAKAKKILGYASKKVAPAVAAVSAIPAKVASLPAKVAALPAAAFAALPAKVTDLPAAAYAALPSVSGISTAAIGSLTSVAGLPAAALAAIKPEPVRVPVPVVDVYEVPVSHTQYQVAQPNAHFSSAIVSSYKDSLDTPRTYTNGYSVSLLPASEVSTQYQYYSVPSATRDSYGAADLPEVSESHDHTNEDTDTEVIAPHSSYGVPY